MPKSMTLIYKQESKYLSVKIYMLTKDFWQETYLFFFYLLSNIYITMGYLVVYFTELSIFSSDYNH